MDFKCHSKGFGIILDSRELGKCLTQRSMTQLSFKNEHLDSTTDHALEGSKELLCYFSWHSYLHKFRIRYATETLISEIF